MSKRKRVVLNFQQKLDILQQLNQGRSGATLAKQYNIGTSTISDLKRNSETILQFVSNLKSSGQISEKKTRKTAKNLDLDSKIWTWYSEKKKKGSFPSDAKICARALEVNRELNGCENFKASSGWLRHFKNRHGIKDKEQSEEGFNIGKQLRNVIKRGGYILENVYNADDCFLLWKSLPGCDNRGKSVVTVIACTNANGSHKLPLCVMGRNGTKVNSNQSVIYTEWDYRFFQNWLEQVFIPQVKNRQHVTGNVGKVLLIIDYPSRDILVKDKDVDVFIVPDDSPPGIQPMEMEITRFKEIYRRKLLKLLCGKSPYPIKQFLEEFTLKESIPVIGEAWDSIPKTRIVESWGKLLSNVKIETEVNRDGILEIVTTTQKIQGLEHCGLEEIKLWLDSDKDYFLSDEETRESENDAGIPSDMQAFLSLDTAIQWFRHQEECNHDQLSTLESLRKLAFSKLGENVKPESD